jgi:hypothetical protein
MAFALIDAFHWEAGEDHAEWTNLDATLPTTDEVTNVGADDGTFCKHLVFGSSHDFEASWFEKYDRATVGTAVLFQVTLRIDDLTDLDSNVYMVHCQRDTGGDGGLAGIKINANGSIDAMVFSSQSIQQVAGSGTVLASSAAGVVGNDAKTVVTCRVVFDNSAGEIQVKVGQGEVLTVTGEDTYRGPGNPGTVWGFGLFLSSVTFGSVDARFSQCTIAEDGDLADFAPKHYQGYASDGVTTDNDGTIFGGEATADAALGAIPAVDTDGITLDNVNDAQGLTFPTPTETGIDTVQLWGAVGDDAAGSEVLRVDLADGTATETGSAIPLSADFGAVALTELLTSPPGAASWDAAKADLEGTLVRTA